jgi:soluble lytic murein transglycosylase-like protein
MQTLISTATSVLGRPVSHIELLDPDVSIEAGTRYIAQEAAKTRLDPPVVACAYNAGGVYPEPSAGNRWRMRQYPIGTSAHADRFVAYFNGCLEETKANPALAGEAPAFAKMI